MHRSRTLLFENPCAHSICSFDRRINHSYMRFCSIRCALLAHYNESGAFFLDLMRDLAHGAAQINPCGHKGLHTSLYQRTTYLFIALGPRPLGPKEIDVLLVPPGKAYTMLTGYLISG